MSLSLLRMVRWTVLWLWPLVNALVSLFYLRSNLSILLGKLWFLVSVLLITLSRLMSCLGRTNRFRVLTSLTGLRPIG